MASWKLPLLMINNKEAIVIIIWCGIYSLCYAISHSLLVALKKYDTLTSILLATTTIIYTLVGVTGEVFIGRYRLINFSMWIQWIAMIMSTFIYALKYAHVYNLSHQWLDNLIVLVPLVAQVLGFSAFQITAVQFGTDLLVGVPSVQLTAFIFWFFCIEQIPWMMGTLFIV